jgi:RecA-family ATPase
MDIKLSDYAPSTFKGDTPARRDLIDDRLPRGKVVMLAGAGDVGKSFLLLQLFNAVNDGMEDMAFGGVVTDGRSPRPITPSKHDLDEWGRVIHRFPCIIFMGEDDRESIDLRLKAIRNECGSSIDHGAIIPVPNIKDSMTFVKRDFDGSIVPTEAFKWLDSQLEALRAQFGTLGFVAVDTFSSLLPIDANKPEEVQAALSLFTGLAARHDVCIIITHHLNKGFGQDKSPEGLRTSIRGTTALVDGVRAAYVMYKRNEEDAKALCDELGIEKALDVVELRIVKNNLGLKTTPVTYVRLPDGVLMDVSMLMAQRSSPEEALLQVIRDANKVGLTIQKTGADGVFASRLPSWPSGLGSWPKAKLESLVTKLESGGQIKRDKSGLTAIETA